MKKLLLTLCAATALPGVAAAHGFEFSQSGMAGVYYGIMETRDNNNVSNMPNRLVFRSDGNLEGAYKFENQTRLGVHADYTLVFRQHDKDYNDGDWRFYPYALAENPKYGKFTVGHTYNAAFQLHQGAQEITWIGIQDSNLPYWLTSANWVNGLKTVKFATPKSTNIMDDGRSFKFSYFTPMIGNTKFGFSYAPDNASRRGMVSRYTSYQKKEDGYTAAMQNKWNPGLGDLYTSVAYGLFNRPIMNGLSVFAGLSINLTFRHHIKTLILTAIRIRFPPRHAARICRHILIITGKARHGTSASDMILAASKPILLISIPKPKTPVTAMTYLFRPTVIR